MIPKVNGQSIQLKIAVPIYKNVYKRSFFRNKKTTISNGEILINVWTNRDDIRLYGNLLDNEQISKTQCRIFNRESREYSIVEHTLEELEEVLQTQRVGYKTNRDEV